MQFNTQHDLYWAAAATPLGNYALVCVGAAAINKYEPMAVALALSPLSQLSLSA